MKASKFTDAQKAFILKQGSDGIPMADNRVSLKPGAGFGGWHCQATSQPRLGCTPPSRSNELGY